MYECIYVYLDSVEWLHCINSYHYQFVQDGATVLHMACMKGHLKVAETLITAHASVNAQTKVSVHRNTL